MTTFFLYLDLLSLSARICFTSKNKLNFTLYLEIRNVNRNLGKSVAQLFMSLRVFKFILSAYCVCFIFSSGTKPEAFLMRLYRNVMSLCLDSIKYWMVSFGPYAIAVWSIVHPAHLISSNLSIANCEHPITEMMDGNYRNFSL